MHAEILCRSDMILLFLGSQTPRFNYRFKARKHRKKGDLGEPELSEKKIHLASMMVSGLGTNFFVLFFLIDLGLIPWSFRDLPSWVRWVGISLGFLVCLLSSFIHRTLALYFTPTLQTIEDHRLITGGSYHYIRQPTYTSFFILFAASTLISANWMIGLLGLMYSLLILNRVKAEEKMLLVTFGSEYQSYTIIQADFC